MKHGMRVKQVLVGVLATSLMFGSAVDASAGTTIKIAGAFAAQPLVAKIATAWHTATGNSATVAGGGAGFGVACGSTGTCDIGMSSRDKTSSDGGFWTPFAKDGLDVVVNPWMHAHGVSNLTIAQVKGIFLGTIRNWHSVGGPNKTIQVYQRAASTGTESMFKLLFLGSSSAVICCNAPALLSDGIMRQTIGTHKYAIGFDSMYFQITGPTDEYGVSIDGVAPTLLNAKSGRYKYIRTFYYVTQVRPTGLVASFINYTLTTHVQHSIVGQYWIPLK